MSKLSLVVWNSHTHEGFSPLPDMITGNSMKIIIVSKYITEHAIMKESYFHRCGL